MNRILFRLHDFLYVRGLAAALFVLTAGLVLTPLSAQAKDKYGTDLTARPLPVILGVTLNGPVSDYSDFVKDSALSKEYDMPVYQREADLGKEIEDAGLSSVSYLERGGRVRGIIAIINAADAYKLKSRLDKLFGSSRLQRDFSFKWPCDGFVLHLEATENVEQRQLVILWDPDSVTPPPGPQKGDITHDIWGDPEVRPPVIDGVRLGDKVSQHPQLKRLPDNGKAAPGREFYGGPDGELQNRKFEGALLKDLSFTAYKGVIYIAAFKVSKADGDKLINAFKGQYFLPKERRDGSLFWDVYEFEADMQPISGDGLRQVIFNYRPVRNQSIKDKRGDAPVTINGVTLGGKISDYTSLRRRAAMPYGVDYYTSPSYKPLFGINIDLDSYGVFEGRIVTATFKFEAKYLPAAIKGLTELYGPPDYGDSKHYYGLNLGDVEVEAFVDGNGVGVVDYVHSPLKWATDRAVDKYMFMNRQ